MTLSTILLIVLVLILIGVVPVWPHARQWGYAPSGVAVVALLVLLFLLMGGRI